MSALITVMKFGGTSLEDSSGFERVTNLLRSHDVDAESSPVVVVSAMSGVTDALTMSLRFAREGQRHAAAQSLERHLERHLEVAERLGPTAALRMQVVLERARQKITDLLETAGSSRTKAVSSREAVIGDAITSFGEILSAQLLTLVLNENGSPAFYVDARRCIKTNREHGNATPLRRETELHTRAELQPLLEQKKLPVLGGFIGATKHGATTTMGRGSSDFTATLVSAALNARETQIWTDVNGVHTADPGVVREARPVSRLSYDEAEEMARFGAKVLHRRMFDPVRTQQIPIRICNSNAPQEPGTLISARPESREWRESPNGTIKAIAHRNHLVRIDIKSTPAFVANGFQRSIEAVLKRHHLPIDIVATAEDGLSLACDEGAALEAIIDDLDRCGSIGVTGRVAVVSCVGEGLRGSTDGGTLMRDILKAFDPTLAWQKTSSINLVTVVDGDLVGQLVQHLHREIFE